MQLTVKAWDKVLTICFGLIIVAALWPGSFWLSVDNVTIPNVKAGEPVIMSVRRNIKREFDASWHVAVRKQTGRSSWRIVCTADGATDYIPEASLPEPLTLDWWTNGSCTTLQPGSYRVHTTWQLEPKYSPTKRVTAVSNIFEVEP